MNFLYISEGLWIGSDDYNTANSCASKVYEQLQSIESVQHPLDKTMIKVFRRTTADGKTRRSSTGASSACSSYPIPEAPEHVQQLGDMTIIFEEPVWTVDETKKYEDLFPTWLNNRKDNQTNRREFGKQHFGNQGRMNITGSDLKRFYPPAMHRGLRCAETIGRRVGHIADIKNGSKAEWYKAMATVARKSNPNNEQSLTFTEDGVVAFFQNFDKFLKQAAFSGLEFDILSTFGKGLHELCIWLLRTPVGLTGADFDIHSRALLGFQFVHIFGSRTITATIKQISVYTGYYVEQARQDSILTGLPISLQHFSDGIMETAHKTTKSGHLVFSGGRSGPTSSISYQESILSQQIMNHILQTQTNENIPNLSSAKKVKRKLCQENGNENGVKRSKLGVSSLRIDSKLHYFQFSVLNSHLLFCLPGYPIHGRKTKCC